MPRGTTVRDDEPMKHHYHALVWIDHQVARVFHTFIRQKHPQLASRISAVETLDHPTDGELLAHGRRFFRADDRMRVQV